MKNNGGTSEGTSELLDTRGFQESEEQVKEQQRNKSGTKKGTSEGTSEFIDTTELQENKEQVEEQQGNSKRNTDNKYNNIIYLYLLNKYSVENRKSFYEYMQKTRELRNDEKWNELTRDEQQKILSEI